MAELIEISAATHDRLVITIDVRLDDVIRCCCPNGSRYTLLSAYAYMKHLIAYIVFNIEMRLAVLSLFRWLELPLA